MSRHTMSHGECFCLPPLLVADKILLGPRNPVRRLPSPPWPQFSFSHRTESPLCLSTKPSSSKTSNGIHSFIDQMNLTKGSDWIQIVVLWLLCHLIIVDGKHLGRSKLGCCKEMEGGQIWWLERHQCVTNILRPSSEPYSIWVCQVVCQS